MVPLPLLCCPGQPLRRDLPGQNRSKSPLSPPVAGRIPRIFEDSGKAASIPQRTWLFCGLCCLLVTPPERGVNGYTLTIWEIAAGGANKPVNALHTRRRPNEQNNKS